MENQETVKVEIEWSLYTWWYMCEECHSAISSGDVICKGCKRKLDWSDVLLKKG